MYKNLKNVLIIYEINKKNNNYKRFLFQLLYNFNYNISLKITEFN